MIDADLDAVAGRPGIERGNGQDGGGRRVQQRPAGRRGGLDDTDDPGVGAAVQEELPHPVAHFGIRRQAAEGALEIGKAVDARRLVDRPAWRGADEGRDGRGDTGNGADTTRNFLDVNPGRG